MPEMFIPEIDVDTSAQEEAAKLEEQAAEFAAIAAHGEWLATQPETIRTLGEELATKGKQAPRFALGTKVRRGVTIYTAESPNGYHESKQSHEHALFLLVDSFRVRVEDTPEVHARILSKSGGDIKSARALAAHIARTVREAHPKVSGEERDALVLAALQEREDRQDGKIIEEPDAG